jgi:hypothetical protein
MPEGPLLQALSRSKAGLTSVSCSWMLKASSR